MAFIALNTTSHALRLTNASFLAVPVSKLIHKGEWKIRLEKAFADRERDDFCRFILLSELLLKTYCLKLPLSDFIYFRITFYSPLCTCPGENVPETIGGSLRPLTKLSVFGKIYLILTR